MSEKLKPFIDRIKKLKVGDVLCSADVSSLIAIEEFILNTSKEELSEEALYKLLAELEQNQSVTFDMIQSDKDEIVGAIISRFRIPKENEALKDCKAAVEKTKEQ